MFLINGRIYPKPVFQLAVMLLLFLLLSCSGNTRPQRENQGYLRGADGAELFFRVMGSGTDTLVVLHGGPGAGMQSILPAIEPLARHFILIAYDQRGGGRSTLPADTTKLQANHFVEDLEAVRVAFGLDRMNVVAHSFGSILLAQYALKYPQRLRRVVMHGATGPKRSEMAKYYQAKSIRTRSLSDTALVNRSGRKLQELLRGFADDPVATCLEYEALSREISVASGETSVYQGTTCDAPAEAIRYYYRYTAQLAPNNFGDWDYTDTFKSLSVPMLVVYGADDSLGISPQRAWVETASDGRLLLVPKAGKGAFSDNPGFLVPRVVEFFLGAWPQGAKKVDPGN